jgi:WD40 repeat protein
MYVAAAEKPFLATIEGKDVRLFWTPEHAPPQQPEMRWWSEAKKVTTGMRRVYDAAYMEGDGFLRVYGGGGSVETWRIVAVPRRSPPQPEPAGRFDAPVDGVRCAALAPDGHEGLSGYDDGHIGVWKLPFARPQPSDIFAGVAKYIQIKFTDADFDALETEFGAYRSRRVFVPTSDDALATAYETLFAPAAAQRTDLAWKSHFNMIDEWIKAKPTSVTPRIVQAGSLVKHAWEARGSGFAHTVTEKGFALFHERLQAARDALEKAIKLDPNDPEIYELVVHIGQGGLYSRKEVDQAVEKCRALAPDYAPLYTTMAVYLLPRWHGEPGELEKWVDSVTEAGTPLGDSLYARVAATVLRFERDGFGSRAESEYARIKNGFDVLTERFPESTWVASQRAYFASMHHDLATAQEAFRQMDQLQALHPTSIWGTDEIYDRARRWADPNAPRGQERLLIWGATWSINKVHVTPDGKQIISVGRERKAPIGIWSRESGKLIDWMPAGGLQIHSATVSPDGLLAYVGGLHHPSGQVLLLRANIRRLEIDGVIPCQTNARMKQVAVSDDGTLMAAAFGDTKVRLWNLEDGSEQEGIVHEAPVTRVLFSSDSKRLATQSGGHAHVWDVESGKLLDTFESADSDAAIALSPDGQLLAVYEDGGKAAIWNLTTKQKTTADETFPIMLAAAFSHDGLMLAVGTYDGRDRAIKVVDVASGTVLKTFLGHFDHVQSLAFAPDDTELISGSDDCTVRVWDLSGLKKKAPAPPGEDQ